MIIGRPPARAHRQAVANAEPTPVFLDKRAEGTPRTPVARPQQKPRTRTRPCTHSSPRSGPPAAPPSPAAPTRCGSVWLLPTTSGTRQKAPCANYTWKGTPTPPTAHPIYLNRKHPAVPIDEPCRNVPCRNPPTRQPRSTRGALPLDAFPHASAFQAEACGVGPHPDASSEQASRFIRTGAKRASRRHHARGDGGRRRCL